MKIEVTPIEKDILFEGLDLWLEKARKEIKKNSIYKNIGRKLKKEFPTIWVKLTDLEKEDLIFLVFNQEFLGGKK